MAKKAAKRRFRAHTAEEAKHVIPPWADPGMIEEPPDPVLYFWIDVAGAPNTYHGPGVTTAAYHIGAADETQARETVEEIEQAVAVEHGHTAWKVTASRPATQHVDPSGEADYLYEHPRYGP